MPKKLFLSFLGTSNYEEVRYFNVDITSALSPMRFVQEATFRFHGSDFGKGDKILIFTTPLANQRNWKDFNHFNFKTKEEEFKIGLENRLKNAKLPCEWRNIDIPDGQSTEEIWEIFNIIFEQIGQDDELFFDITHGFRSIPMLNMVLINYAKLLKDIKVGGIYYGAFEAKIKNEIGEFCSPIWNLTSFSELQDWSIAASNFLEAGDTADIVKLTKDKIAPTMRETKGQDATARSLNSLSKSIEKLAGVFATNRGREIVSGKTFEDIKKHLETLQNNRNIIEPLKPILQQLEEKIAEFSAENELNWLEGAKWCLRHNLIQQGFTQLQEGMITQGILQTRGILQLDFTNYSHREIVKQAFIIRNNNFPEAKWISPSRDNKIIASIFVQSDIVENLYKVFQKITDLRNDINHCGYTKATSYDKFKKEFINVLNEVETYFKPKK